MALGEKCKLLTFCNLYCNKGNSLNFLIRYQFLSISIRAPIRGPMNSEAVKSSTRMKDQTLNILGELKELTNYRREYKQCLEIPILEGEEAYGKLF